MSTPLNYEGGYKYLWGRVQITIDLIKEGQATEEQIINLLEVAQITAEQKCID